MKDTKLAEAYLGALWSEPSAAFGIDLGLNNTSQKLNVSLTVTRKKTANPGPGRGGAASCQGTLDEFDTLRLETVSMRRRFWPIFVEWLEQEMGVGAFYFCLTSPPMLLAYGGRKFSAGAQLVSHTHLEYPL